ncbi:hypothetical protein [Xanthomonas albilineans]|uniref:hypothetical protein n=1 Tax=Xanthomonas albilineans TaxID=29447 RepID=UPI0005F346C1|nr:hypothetical protein [Xanthomonas albilineans]
MSAPVDVIATMQAIRDHGLSAGSQWYDMPEATDAVASVLDAASALIDEFDRHGKFDPNKFNVQMLALAVAVWRARGGK